MNCLNARETLDLARPGEISGEIPGAVAPLETCPDNQLGQEFQRAAIDEAARHVNGCPACQIFVRRREKIDARIGQLSRDVPVPAGLRERLLARLEVAGGSVEGGAILAVPEMAGKPAVRSRRRMMVSAVAVCAVVISSVAGWQFLRPRPALLTMEEIADLALSAGINPNKLPVLTQFKGGLNVELPKTTSPFSRLQPFQRLVDAQLGDREIAVYFFTLAGRKGGKFAGRLIAVPASSVKDLPVASSFPGRTDYKYGYCMTAWVEGKFVYVCCVFHGGEDELFRLRPATA